MSGWGTYLKNKSIYSSLVGKVEKTGNILSVKPLKTRYKGETGDVVIGRVVEITNKKWLLDI